MGRHRVDTRKFCTVRVVRCLGKFLREVVDASSLDVFKAKLDKALRNLI